MNLSPFFRLLLWPWSLLYAAVVHLRTWMYARGILRSKKLQSPVVSVGNLTVGGTGKTPMVIWLAERFLAEGKRVGVLSRGYRGSAESSDEIELIRNRLQNRALFGIGPDRYQNGLRLQQQGVDIFLLDDGYQHLQLARDVNILLMDASRPLGKEHLLPAGRLREPVAAMNRADILVITRANTVPGTAQAIQGLRGYPVFAANTKLLGFHPLNDSELQQSPGPGPFFVFCGIGNPGAFQLDLERWGIEIAGKRSFADHHRYTQAEVGELEIAADDCGAAAFLTTEKDAQNFGAISDWAKPVFVAVIELEMTEASQFLETIKERLPQPVPA